MYKCRLICIYYLTPAHGTHSYICSISTDIHDIIVHIDQTKRSKA